MAPFYEIVDRLNVEDVVHTEPKKVIRYFRRYVPLTLPMINNSTRGPANPRRNWPMINLRTHDGFQYPAIASPSKPNEVYETTKKILKLVLPVDYIGVSHTIERDLDQPARYPPERADITHVGDKPLPINGKLKLDLQVLTLGGPLVLQNVICWVTEHNLLPGIGDLLLSWWIMKLLGYNRETYLSLRSNCVLNRITAGPPVVAEAKRSLGDGGARACFPHFGKDVIDVFRIIIGCDLTVEMPPMENPQSKWCPSPHVVTKRDTDDHCMIVDVRGPNACVESVVWSMPILETAFEQFRGRSERPAFNKLINHVVKTMESGVVTLKLPVWTVARKLCRTRFCEHI
ncbi:hypothetical protein P3T76_005214 [Phytophthora citrophthora]|uniref:Uncharacterized protein n=1 Tax=Phytophthora citrophthora TaxID=4793 RepID=A0AAD9GTD6_9STRA|nr:hypothetical protein P3T76_005214 [Phytophthora citrophthora]